MKKILATISFLSLLSSCVSYNQETLNLNLPIVKKYSDVGGNKSVELIVVDSRKDKDLLGNKRLGEKLITIKSSQNLTDSLRDKISRDLEQNGFLLTSSTNNFSAQYSADKSLEVKILTLNYSAYREFFIGNSKIEILLKIVAKNKSGGAVYSTSQSLSLDKKHFIMPLITTDEKTINTALQEAIDGILANQKLLEFLKN